MKKVNIRIFLTSFLALFLLGTSPIANVSTNIKDTAFSSVATNEYKELASVEKKEISDPKTKTFVHYSYPTRGGVTLASSNSINPVVASGNYISIAGNVIPTFGAAVQANNTLPDSGNAVGVYRGKFYYGHNSGHVFGPIAYLRPGSTFTITTNGVTKTYRVQVMETVQKSALTKSVLNSVYNATYKGSYSVSLMTCAGQSYGNGDASHRIIIMASQI